MKFFIVNVVVRDRVGVVAEVTEALYALGANLEALSQTVVQGWFTMLASISMPDDAEAGDIGKALESAGEFHATVLAVDSADASIPPAGEPYVVTVEGQDQAGIFKELTRIMAAAGANLDDVWNEVREGRFIVVFRLTLPSRVDPKSLRYDLAESAGSMGLTLTMQHQDIFTATNSLSVHTTPSAMQRLF
jgi:glycine cleavage system transcriptional repressor